MARDEIGQEPPSVHDNFVYGYTVACERRTITLHTEYRDVGNDADREFTDVIFTGVVAHHFEHVPEGNVQFDVEEVGVESLVEHDRALFERGCRYGWPGVKHRTVDELAAKLRASGTKAFEIIGSYGMSGWVLAEAVEYRRRDGEQDL